MESEGVRKNTVQIEKNGVVKFKEMSRNGGKSAVPP